jgi:capsular polysaccharide biosynthesis protein
MDFWDVAKVLGRRWYVTLPLLALTITSAVVALQVLKPNYQATANVALVGGSVEQQPRDGQAARVNPWQPGSLVSAVQIPLTSKSVHDQLEASGYASEWTVKIAEGDLAVLQIAVVAPTSAQASNTATKIASMIIADVKQRQANLRLQPGELITTQQLEAAPTVEKTSSNIIRAVVVTAGVGLLATIAFAIAIDALLRRRSRRRTGSWSGMPAVATAGAVGPPVRSAAIGTSYRSSSNVVADDTVIFHRVSAVDPPNITLPPFHAATRDDASSERSAPASAPVSPMPPGESGRSELGLMKVEFQSFDDLNDSDDAQPEDATIVLPLSNAPSRGTSNGGRPTGAARP